MIRMPRVLLSLVLAAAAGGAGAADLSLNVEIPNLPVAEYHRPYVAIWIEAPDQTIAANLAVWYQLRGDHTKWLPDLRQWWRRGGRDLKVPVDGLTGATRPVGQHLLKFDAAAGAARRRSRPATTRWWSRRCARWAAARRCEFRSNGRSRPRNASRSRAPRSSAPWR